MTSIRHKFSFLFFGLATLLFWSAIPARAHCDTMDGPVVKAAQKALEMGNVNLVLIWVRENDEPEIREAFARTVAVRRFGAEARALADHYFFETLVRVHRAGEGMPFTGLKPAGGELGPTIPAADRALVKGSSEEVETLLMPLLREEIGRRFRAVQARRAYPAGDVAAGRRFVEAYVSFLHYIEAAHEVLSGEKAASHAEPLHKE
jgi:hypothetical protein